MDGKRQRPQGAARVGVGRSWGKRCQTACKPGSVPWFPMVTAIHLGRPLPDASRDRPGRLRGNAFRFPCGKTAAPIWSCSRWGLPCRPCYQVRGALLPHPFTLTHARMGGLLSVALSLGSPPPDVIRHRASVEPGLSSHRLLEGRPSSRLTRLQCGLPIGVPSRGQRHRQNIVNSPSRGCCDYLVFSFSSSGLHPITWAIAGYHLGPRPDIRGFPWQDASGRGVAPRPDAAMREGRTSAAGPSSPSRRSTFW